MGRRGLGGRGSRRAARPSRLTRARLSSSFALPQEDTPDAGNPSFIVVAVLRKLLSVNTCGNVIRSHAQDYALIPIKTVLATGCRTKAKLLK